MWFLLDEKNHLICMATFHYSMSLLKIHMDKVSADATQFEYKTNRLW